MKKYIHILYSDEVKFSTPLIKSMNTDFDSSEHLFVTPFAETYEKLRGNGNVVYDAEFGNKRSGKLINKYAPQCKWLFLHSMCPIKEWGYVKRKYLNKIVWRSWGFESSFIKGQPVRNLVKKGVNVIFGENIIKKFRLIGIANIVDVYDLEEKYGKVKNTLPMPYYESSRQVELANLKKSLQHSEDKTVKILVGHSGHHQDRHFEIIEKLKKYKNEDIRLYFLISYGNKDYISEIKRTASEAFGDKAVFVEKMVPYIEYAKFIADMDICFICGEQSYALGNIALMLLFGKTLFLSDNGPISRAFRDEKIPYKSFEQIDTMNYAQLTEPVGYGDISNSVLLPKTAEKCKKYWENIFAFLENEGI